jgi:formate hydrogenlyase subunit 3/multisubunit Na+/H+ antiporter MnhD subunit
MQSLQESDAVYGIWLVIVVSGLVVLLVLARAASVIFWEARGDPSASTARSPWPVAALLALVIASPALVATTEFVANYGRATAEQLLSSGAYVDAVVPAPEDLQRERRP